MFLNFPRWDFGGQIVPDLPSIASTPLRPLCIWTFELIIIHSVALQYSLPTAEFAALSLVPQTPLQRHLSLDTGSANSSVESTPEGPSPIDCDGLRLDLEGLEPIFFGDKFTAMLSAPAPPLDRGCLFSDSVFDHGFFDFPASSLFASGFVC